MSHFTVLVIGENPEKQLAPYHEFECTGENNEYIQEIDKTEEYLKEYEETEKEDTFADFINDYYGHEKVFSESEINREDKHKYGYILCDKQGNVIKCIQRTNPEYKWDWYQLGGRWSGYFKLKENAKDFQVGSPGLMTEVAGNGYADQAYKKDIDFEYMRKEARERAEKRYSEVAKHFVDNKIPVVESWGSIVDNNKDKDRDFWRGIYYSQEGIKLLEEAKKKADKNDVISSVFFRLEDYAISKEKYGEKASNERISSFALVKDNKWYEKGEMGWFGCVFDEKNDWNEEFTKLLDSVPEDTLLSLYDCHI